MSLAAMMGSIAPHTLLGQRGPGHNETEDVRSIFLSPSSHLEGIILSQHDSSRRLNGLYNYLDTPKYLPIT